MKTITLHYSDVLVRGAILAYWKRRLGWSYLFAFAMVAGVFLYCLIAGDTSWIAGVSGRALLMGAAMAVTLYRVHFRGAMSRLRRMPQPWTLGDHGNG